MIRSDDNMEILGDLQVICVASSIFNKFLVKIKDMSYTVRIGVIKLTGTFRVSLIQNCFVRPLVTKLVETYESKLSLKRH